VWGGTVHIYCMTPAWSGWYGGETREWKKEKDRERGWYKNYG